MSTETLTRGPVTDGSGGDDTTHPPLETTFPGADDDDYIRKQADEEIKLLNSMFHGTAEESKPADTTTPASHRQVSRGLAMTEVNRGRHVMPSHYGGPAVAAMFDPRERRRLVRPNFDDIRLGRVAGKASFTLRIS